MFRFFFQIRRAFFLLLIFVRSRKCLNYALTQMNKKKKDPKNNRKMSVLTLLLIFFLLCIYLFFLMAFC